MLNVFLITSTGELQLVWRWQLPTISMINNISDIIGTIIICVLFVHVGECMFALALGAELTFLSYILEFSKQRFIHSTLKRAAAEYM